ncbi:MAG: hypothetical protein II127_05610 [Ruminococcus sp.]|nr:hypothetical protein [Ruminococcus sp.]
MNKAPKMNFLYKIGFILMLVCLALFAASVLVLVILKKIELGVIIAVAGAFLCLIAIILTMFSKPKQPRKRLRDVEELAVNEASPSEEIEAATE